MSSSSEDPEFAAQTAAFAEAQRAALAALSHPVWAVAGLDVVGASAFAQDGARGAVVLHATGAVRLSVYAMTPLTGPVSDVVRAMLAAGLFEAGAMDASGEADMQAEVEARIESARSRASSLPLSSRAFSVDGVDVDFVFAEVDSAWAAAADHDGVRIALMSAGVSPAGLALSALSDPAAHVVSLTDG